jgi:glycosyltransferase domain-containing protein
MPHCSIIVPTHRDTLYARATLSYLAHFADDRNSVIIADNSVSPEKHDFLQRLKRDHPGVQLHLHPENIGGMQNLFFLLENSADSEYLFICSDDDSLSLEFVTTSLEMLENNPSASAAAGHLLGLLTDGNHITEQFKLTQGDPYARLNAWFDPNSFNLVAYSVFRRTAIQPWVDFCRDHPMRACFFDRLICMSTISSGQLVRHANGAYLWSAGNWDTPEANWKSRMRWYVDAGVSENFTHYMDLHFAVESAAFLLCEHSPVVDKALRSQCANIVWERCMNRFRQTVMQNEAAYAAPFATFPDAFDALKILFNHQTAPDVALLMHFPLVLAAFSPDAAAKYTDHLTRIFPKEDGR